MSPNFSDFQRLSKTNNKKQVLKDSRDNTIGVIDENNNLLILNPNYKLQVSETIQSNSKNLIIKNSQNYGIKLDSTLKIISPDGEEKSLSEIHNHDYNNLRNLPVIPTYSEKQFRDACNGQIDALDSKTVNGFYVDNDKLLWDGKKIYNELKIKSNENHTHDVSQIKNLPLSLTEERVKNLIDYNSTKKIQNLTDYFIDQIDQRLEFKSNIEHTHDIDCYTQDEVTEFLSTKSDKDHTHDFPKYTNKDVINVVDNLIGKKLVHKDSVKKELNTKSNIEHKHSEKEITDLDKYPKKQVDKLLKSKSDIDHKHSLNEIAKKDELYSNKDAQKVVQKFIKDEVLLTKNDIYDLVESKSDENHEHSIDIDLIIDEVKDKVKEFLENNINALNSQKLQNHSAQDFAAVNHTHNFQNLKNTKHKHSESDIDNLDKFSREEVNGFLANKANTSHSHTVSDIKNFPKLYRDKDTNYYIQNNLIDDSAPAPNKLYSSERIEALANNRARISHDHKLSDVKEVRGYIERTVEIAVKNNIKNHKHSMFDITDKPTFYNDSQARTAIGGQVNDSGESNTDIWSAKKIKNELEYLKKLIDSK